MSKPLSIAVRLQGGIGDVLIASPMLEALHDVAPDATITAHYHTPGVADFVFHRAAFVQGIQSHETIVVRGPKAADVVLHSGHYPRYVPPNAWNASRVPGLAHAMKLSDERIQSIAGFVAAGTRLDGVHARYSIQNGRSYLDGVGHYSGLPVTSASEIFLALDPAERRDIPRPFLTLHDGFDNRQLPIAGGAVKCWPIAHWTALVRLLRLALPGYALVQLGAGKSRPIPGVDLSLVGTASLAAAAWAIKDATLHIDTDSGLAHLARAVHTPAVVLFGPTNREYYGHSPNVNIASDVCGDCWHSTPDWMGKCPRGLAVPECMDSIHPNEIASTAASWISGITHNAPKVTASAVSCYDGTGRRSTIAMLCSVLGLPPKPITEHISDSTSGLYIHASKQWEYPYAIDRIVEHFKDKHAGRIRVADVGGGRGALAAFLAKDCDVEQFDLDYRWAGDVHLERRYRAWAKAHGYRARFGSIYNVPAPDQSYDVVTCMSVVEHIPHKAAAIRELLRICKPGGIVVLTFDLAIDPDRFRDKMRVEIMSPGLLNRTFSELGIPVVEPTLFEVAASVVKIGAGEDRVAGIPDGMTVAGMVLRVAP